MLITLNPGDQRQITYAASLAHTPPVEQYLVANLDEVQTVYIGPADAGRQVPDLSTDIARSQLVALQGIHVSARQDWYAFCPIGDVFVDVFSDYFAGSAVVLDVVPDSAYWAPSPAQAAEQISALGLMKDTTGQTINSTLGVPAQNATVAQVNTTLGSPAQDGTLHTINTTLGTPAQNAAVTALPAQLQPSLTGVASVRQGVGGSPYTVHTFAANSRIWALHLSFAAASNNSYTSGSISSLYAELTTGSGNALTVVELALSNATQIINGDSDLAFSNGIPIAASDTLLLDVNNGTAVSNATLRASCTALYSSP